MKATLKEQNGLCHEYNVVVEASEVSSQLESELQSIGQRAKIPGFRPGKIPMNVLKQRYGKDSMEKVLWDTVNKHTKAVIEEKNLRPAMQPDIDIKDYDEGKDLIFDLTVHALPEVPELDYDSYTVTDFVFEVPESEILQGIERLADQQKHTHAHPADHKAEQGDVVKIDFEGKRDGVPFDGGKGEGFQLELGSNQFIPGFEDQLIGAKAGDEVQVTVTFPEQYHSPDLAGAEATFDCKVHEVMYYHTPDVNDELAKNFGFDNLDALKDAVREQISMDYKTAAHNKAKKELFDMLDERLDFEVPAKMVELEFESIWGQLQEAKAKGDPSLEGKSDDELKTEYQRIAERRVRLGVLLSEIARKNNIQVSRDELSQAVMAQARMFPGQEQKVFEFYQQNPNHVEELKGPILEDKGVEFILTKVKRTEKKVSIEELFDEEGAESAEVEDKPKKKASTKKKGDKAEDKPKKKPAAKKKTTKKD
ncbi:MAG: trigger factor [Rickettsiales bacterium]|nr:trigger factor [Rickettsiales bacterium]